MKRFALPVLLTLTAVLVAACAPTANPLASQGEDIAGFWLGLWHGFIALFTFIVSLFKENVGVYEVRNNGGWYDLGFLLGAMSFWGGGGGRAASSSRSSRRDRD